MTDYITPFSVFLFACAVIIAHALYRHYTDPRAYARRMQRRALDRLQRKQRDSQRFPE